MWTGTKAQCAAAQQAGTLPLNSLIMITDDGNDTIVNEVIEDDLRAVTSGAVYAALQNVGGGPIFKKQTLTAGSTSVTFTDIPTTSEYISDIYASNGMDYDDIDSSVSGQITVTYEAQASNVYIYLRLEEVVV